MTTQRSFPCWAYKLFLSIFLFVITPFAVHAEVTKLSSELKEILIDSSRFHEINTVKNLPTEVVSLIVGQGNKLADRGQKWEPSDAIQVDKYGRHLPTERFIWAVTDEEYYIVHYERNAALAPRPPALVIIHFVKGEAKILWGGTSYYVKSFKDFLSALDDPNIIFGQYPY